MVNMYISFVLVLYSIIKFTQSTGLSNNSLGIVVEDCQVMGSMTVSVCLEQLAHLLAILETKFATFKATSDRFVESF